eukprot:CAMPEP_0119004246 /NCGR_PEP_ID=MMETSP1176-20130426/1034_1 /TAXON_ID=265551 /ORGANISM="Synedropsis recta cf, Strain CCMP1620" /LENGTH=371 /DNA_ID=CAMNT_0006955931 /DNA_START=87 /DNA_END=1202 /DNA_ORIENTATION=+
MSDNKQDNNDESLIERANEEFAQERLVSAARLLRQVVDSSRCFTPRHLWILQKAERIEQVARNLMTAPGPEWTKQGESHGTYDTMIYYKVSDDGNAKMTARLETPIEQSLLIPLLAVFNETKLYTTWMPRWERPIRSGVRKTQVIREQGRCNQLLLVNTDSPWPFSPREVLIDVVVSDDIDANGSIVVKLDSEVENDDDDVPPVEQGAVRCIFDGGLLFRKCPKDHASFQKSKHHRTTTDSDDIDEGDNQDMILVCCEFMVDPLLTNVPQIMINFITRTALGGIWAALLQIAQDVRDKKHAQLAAAIEEKRDKVYDFVDERIQVMLSSMLEGGTATTEEQGEQLSDRSAVSDVLVSFGVNKEELGEVLGFL